MKRRRRREEDQQDHHHQQASRLLALDSTQLINDEMRARLLPNSKFNCKSLQMLSNQQQQQQQPKQQPISSRSRKQRFLVTRKCPLSSIMVMLSLIILCLIPTLEAQTSGNSMTTTNSNSALKFDPDTNSYSGLTFTFDPRLGKRVEWLHFEHWLAIVQQSSALLYEALNGRAHLAEVRVLIPYKWRQVEWPILHKPGVPIMMNRRLRYADSDVMVGFEDPTYKETPFAVQHDECSKQGLHIAMPISFLEQSSSQSNSQQQLDVRLKARQLIREFASHRYGIFKESGFRNDFMYPPFVSLPGSGVAGSSLTSQRRPSSGGFASLYHASNRTGLLAHALILDNVDSSQSFSTSTNQTTGAARNVNSAQNNPNNNNNNHNNNRNAATNVRGFDENWNECSFETTPANGLPTPQSTTCLPYLARLTNGATELATPALQLNHSFNLMSTDPFSYVDLSSINKQSATGAQPLEWTRDLADSARWHFCGENFPLPAGLQGVNSGESGVGQATISNGELAPPRIQRQSFAHNQLAANKQNVMCQERSAMEVIKASDDFHRSHFSPSNFNRLPATSFKFFQEMPPRLILCTEYAAHLYQSRRLDHGILEAAIGKFLAYDLIADTEMALVLFGQHHSTKNSFKRLDLSTDSRLTLYNPPIDPFDEVARYYTEQELLAMDIHTTDNNNGEQQQQQLKLVKGSCSFAKAISEAFNLQQQRNQYDDVGVDIVMVTSGLFVEDELKLEEVIKNYYQRLDSAQLSIIIYPSSVLFDTKSARDGSVILSQQESDIIVKSRLSKLLLIQRLTGAKVHLIKEHLDSNGDVKMSTLVQFYQVFEHIARGHSWDQTHSMALLSHQTVETATTSYRQQVNHHQASSYSSTSGNNAPTQNNNNNNNNNKQQLALNFQFELDSSIQNELIVAFIDPKQHQPRSSGKRFAIRQLQLRSPGGSLVLADSLPSSSSNGNQLVSGALTELSPAWSSSNEQASNELLAMNASLINDQAQLPEATLFPYRSQLGLAGFHLRANHLNGTHSLAGKWTLSALSDEPLQTSAIAMARVNPAGDTVTAHCWIQTYYTSDPASADSSQTADQRGQILKQVKVFAQTKSGVHMGIAQEIQARMEVQDELGNIVQNVHMLDDGLGAPDMTRGDGIHSQVISPKASRVGYYKVMVEMSGSAGFSDDSSTLNGRSNANRANNSPLAGSPGQDSACCGSYVPQQQQQQTMQQPNTRYLSRQLYCGSFFAEPNNKLSQQRPPRINNLTVVNVDQDNRRLTLRWFEPQLDITVPVPRAREAATSPETNELLGSGGGGGEPLDSMQLNESEMAQSLVQKRATRSKQMARSLLTNTPAEETEEDRRDIDLLFDSINTNQQQRPTSGSNQIRGLVLNGKPVAADSQPTLARYEIKMFTDRDSIKRAFDAKQEVGFRFNQWNSEGAFPNASSGSFGGLKEVTLRIPNGREGIYHIAMKVYNNVGLGSQLSPIVSFYMRGNLTLEEAQFIYGSSGTSVDSDGNVYDKNGELINGSGNNPLTNYSILRGGVGGTSSLDGISILVFICVLAFILSIVCISLVACLASSARKSFGKQRSKCHHDNDNKAAQSAAIIGSQTGSGSSMVSGCGSSQQSEVASSASSQADVELSNGNNKLQHNAVGGLNAFNETDLKHTINYSHLQQQQHYQQQQAHLIQAQHKLTVNQQQQQQLGGCQFDEQQKLEQQQYSDAIYQRQQIHDFGNKTSHWPPPVTTSSGANAMMQPQHTMINGYAYATVNHLLNSDGLSSSQIGGNIQLQGEDNLGNQNGLGVVAMSPVQSWPADILISHYDKVKQARERNEAPPVMRIETLETPNIFADGLPSVVSDDQLSIIRNQPINANATTANDQSYLVRQQRNQMPSYLNQQLQHQLSSVLRNKQQQRNNSSNSNLDNAANQHDDLTRKSSPALDGVTDQLSLDMDQSAALNYQLVSQIQPPPQYTVYNADGVNASQQQMQQLITEPSIYSQATNLQQVPTSAEPSMGYYANQWQANQVNSSAPGYGSQQQQHYQQQDEYARALDKCNSAISEV